MNSDIPTKFHPHVGKRVARKRDGATGVVVSGQDVLSSRTARRPFSALYTVRFDDPAASPSGDWVGGTSALRSFFRFV